MGRVRHYISTEPKSVECWANHMLDEGYVPLGGVSTFKVNGTVRFVLYMIKQRKTIKRLSDE